MTTVRKSILVVAAVTGLLLAAAPVGATSQPSGERFVGNADEGHGAVIEPAYDDSTGNRTYLLTPTGAPNPTNASSSAVAPLYIVVYPASYPGWTLNCMGVPGNCPDHDGLIAGAATAIMPGVYGTDPAAVPGHDHLIGLARTGGDSNVARHVWVILFTNSAAANTRITTLSQLQGALEGGNAISVDSGIIFSASAVPASVYWQAVSH
jgi:hypothetical protein